MSTGSGDQEILPSVYSSSEHESSDEELEEQPSEEDAASTPTRTIQVVATAPRPRRGSGDSSDEDGDQDEAKSKSEDEGEAARATADGPARGRSYLQSIRARKPKKKVYAKPKDEQGTDATSERSRDNTSEERENTPELDEEPHTGGEDESSMFADIHVHIEPYTSSGGSDSSESESDVEWKLVTSSATHVLTQEEIEEARLSEGSDMERDLVTGSTTHVLTQEEIEEARLSEGSNVERDLVTGSATHTPTQVEIEEAQLQQSPRESPQLNPYTGSFCVELESNESDDAENLTGVFEMMSYDKEPDILKKDSVFRRRANKAIKTAIEQKPKETEEDSDGGLCNCNCFKKKDIPGVKKKEPPATQLSPQLKKASNEGFNMMKKLFFPALPHLLRDAWVYLEFGITIFAFTFGLLSLDLNDGSKAFNIVFLALTSISVLLASTDWFIYFLTMGSCAECIKICNAKLKKESELELLENEDEIKGRCRMSKQYKEKFDTYYELVRNIVTEIILYPLLICDLFDFIVGGVFRNVSTSDRINFTLFVAGSLYLILSVYVMRMFLIIGSLLSLKRLPKLPNDSESKGSNIRLLTQFSVHILLQIFIHFLLILSIALKIRHENPDFGNQDSIFASSFLWINVVLGGLIPFMGIGTFIITNYYHMREFSISFWIDMMSMLQAPSFTDAVFPSEDGGSPADAALDFVKKSELKKVKKHFERYKSPSWYTKFFFPLKLPLMVLIGSLYVICLFVFAGSLILTQNGSTVEVVLFKDIPITVAFFLCGILMTAFNVKIIVLALVFFIISAILIVGVILAIAIVLPFIVLIYLPIGCCVLQYSPKSLLRIPEPLEETNN